MFDAPHRRTGLLLLFTALATAVSVFARVSADADQPTLAESLAAVSENQAAYLAGGTARFVSGVSLLLAGWFLRRVLTSPGNPAVQVTSFLLTASGALTAISGVSAMALGVSAPGVTGSINSGIVPPIIQFLAELRWLAGKAGFTAAGLGLAAAAMPMWKPGGAFRIVAPASVVVGVAMLFIWVDAATFMHRITGPAFLVWTIVVGCVLLTRHEGQRSPEVEGVIGLRQG
jgi:hypothetical protein